MTRRSLRLPGGVAGVLLAVLVWGRWCSGPPQQQAEVIDPRQRAIRSFARVRTFVGLDDRARLRVLVFDHEGLPLEYSWVEVAGRGRVQTKHGVATFDALPVGLAVARAGLGDRYSSEEAWLDLTPGLNVVHLGVMTTGTCTGPVQVLSHDGVPQAGALVDPGMAGGLVDATRPTLKADDQGWVTLDPNTRCGAHLVAVTVTGRTVQSAVLTLIEGVPGRIVLPPPRWASVQLLEQGRPSDLDLVDTPHSQRAVVDPAIREIAALTREGTIRLERQGPGLFRVESEDLAVRLFASVEGGVIWLPPVLLDGRHHEVEVPSAKWTTFRILGSPVPLEQRGFSCMDTRCARPSAGEVSCPCDDVEGLTWFGAEVDPLEPFEDAIDAVRWGVVSLSAGDPHVSVLVGPRQGALEPLAWLRSGERLDVALPPGTWTLLVQGLSMSTNREVDLAPGERLDLGILFVEERVRTFRGCDDAADTRFWRARTPTPGAAVRLQTSGDIWIAGVEERDEVVVELVPVAYDPAVPAIRSSTVTVGAEVGQAILDCRPPAPPEGSAPYAH